MTLMPMPSSDGSQEAYSTERIIGGLENPDRSFIWWIEALRSQRQPDMVAVTKRLDEIYALAWPERISRFSKQVGRLGEDDRGRFVLTEKGEAGFALYGPYIPLRAGRYEAKLEMEVHGGPTPAIADIRTVKGEIASREVRNSGVVSFPFELQETAFGFEFRVQATGSGTVLARHHLDIKRAT